MQWSSFCQACKSRQSNSIQHSTCRYESMRVHKSNQNSIHVSQSQFKSIQIIPNQSKSFQVNPRQSKVFWWGHL